MKGMVVPDHTPVLDPGRIPRKAEGFVSRSIGDETIIVPVRGGVGDLEAIFTLNAVGASIWWLIDGTVPVERLAAAIAAEYEVTAEEAARDVGEFIQVLTDKGLLAGPGGGAEARP